MSDKNNVGLKMKYFVLKPEGNDEYAHASRSAMLLYAYNIQSINPELALDLRRWVDSITGYVSDTEEKGVKS